MESFERMKRRGRAGRGGAGQRGRPALGSAMGRRSKTLLYRADAPVSGCGALRRGRRRRRHHAVTVVTTVTTVTTATAATAAAAASAPAPTTRPQSTCARRSNRQRAPAGRAAARRDSADFPQSPAA
ncbi:hypothetical protein [Burkholderia multivorans]|uniref:hypothetical protein n=1 Tax=Burkholderia multivorans TaxID=87883 RepID=UPI0015E32D94|nr:hypothetical protein [Burkholderia multivorans]